MNVYMLINKPIRRKDKEFLNMSAKSIGGARSASKRTFDRFNLRLLNLSLKMIPLIIS